MDISIGPGNRTCPDHGHRLVPVAFHPGVFEHAYCPHCDQALVWLGERGETLYRGERQASGWKVRLLQGAGGECSRGEFRLHRTWISRGIGLFLEGRGRQWTLCHDGVEVEALLEFDSVSGYAVKVARCGECRTFNVFLVDPLYGEEILCLFPFGENDLPDIRRLELLPVRIHKVDAATTMAILDEVLRRLLPPPAPKA